jgi:hypothetical protein
MNGPYNRLLAENESFLYAHNTVPYVKNRNEDLITCFDVKIVTVSKHYMGMISGVKRVQFTHSYLQYHIKVTDDPSPAFTMLSVFTVFRFGRSN